MRWSPIVVASLSLAACGEVSTSTDAAIDSPLSIDAAIDAPAIDAPAIDAAIDAPACTPRQLLVGGQPVQGQGWIVVQQGSAQLTYVGDYTRLETNSPTGGAPGQLLLTLPGAITAGQPFSLAFVVLVESVTAHNTFDAGAAILASFSGSFGSPAERAQMIYLDPRAIGFADDTASFPVNLIDNAYHTIRLDHDGAGTLRVSVDGAVALTRPGFTTNGAIAIGDQTNDANFDSKLRIRNITALCP